MVFVEISDSNSLEIGDKISGNVKSLKQNYTLVTDVKNFCLLYHKVDIEIHGKQSNYMFRWSPKQRKEQSNHPQQEE